MQQYPCLGEAPNFFFAQLLNSCGHFLTCKNNNTLAIVSPQAQRPRLILLPWPVLVFQVRLPADLRHLQPGLLALLPLRQESKPPTGNIEKATL